MKKLLKIAGPVLMVVGLLLVAKFPQPARAMAAGTDSAMDLSSPHWHFALFLMSAGLLCLLLQALLKE